MSYKKTSSCYERRIDVCKKVSKRAIVPARPHSLSQISLRKKKKRNEKKRNETKGKEGECILKQNKQANKQTNKQTNKQGDE